MPRKELPKEIKPETWKKALEEEALEQQEAAKLRKPGEPPIVSTVEQQILEEILEEKEKEKQGPGSKSR